MIMTFFLSISVFAMLGTFVQGQTNYSSGIYKSPIYPSQDCTGDIVGYAYENYGACLPAKDPTKSVNFVFNYNTDGTVIQYQQTFGTTNCAGDVVSSKITSDFVGGCFNSYYPFTGNSYGSGELVSSMGCTSQTGYNSLDFATSNDCSNPDSAFRCESFINNYCTPNPSAGSGYYQSLICGENPYYFEAVQFDPSSGYNNPPTCYGLGTPAKNYYGSCYLVLGATDNDLSFYQGQGCGTSVTTAAAPSCASPDDVDENITLSEANVALAVLILVFLITILVITVRKKEPMASS